MKLLLWVSAQYEQGNEKWKQIIDKFIQDPYAHDIY